MSEDSVKVSLRIRKELYDFVERQVQVNAEKGIRSTVTDEIEICILHRMLAMLPAWQRAALEKKIGAPVAAAATPQEEKQGELSVG